MKNLRLWNLLGVTALLWVNIAAYLDIRAQFSAQQEQLMVLSNKLAIVEARLP